MKDINTFKYVNLYQTPGSEKITASIHDTRALADANWQPPKGGWPTSRKERIACVRMPIACIHGQFDF